MHPIKIVYNFIVSIQVIVLVVFIFYLIDSQFEFVYPIDISFTIPLDYPLEDIVFDYSVDLTFDNSTLELMLLGMSLLYIISSVNVVGSGIMDSGTITLKQIISFLAKYIILIFPILFFISQSAILDLYFGLISLIIFVIYVLAFLIDIGEEKNNV